jgi:lauroyl/myristoyl acyltransferase
MDEVKAAIARDPHCAVLVAFDHLSGRRRRSVPFLGGSLSAPTGLAYLANETRAAVITVWWELARFGPRVRVGDAYGVDSSLPEDERRDELHDRMFRVLEERVSASPGTWTEWGQCHDA